MTYSPWGHIQHTEQFAPGFRSVSTSSHGGFMISRGFADEHLTFAARNRGMRYTGDYLCYEEDCDWAIPAIELPEYWEEIFRWSSEDVQKDPYTHLLTSLSRWHPDYLLERGLTPLPGPYQQHLAMKRDREMRKEKHPDLIVSAVGDWHERVPEGAAEVTTADDVRHLVTAASYVIRTPNLLSLCTLFQEGEDGR